MGGSILFWSRKRDHEWKYGTYQDEISIVQEVNLVGDKHNSLFFESAPNTFLQQGIEN